MNKAIGLVACNLVLMCIPTLVLSAETNTNIAKDSTEQGSHHTNAKASYSIDKIGNTVKIVFNHHCDSVQNQGGGKCGFRFHLVDAGGKDIANWHATGTIGENRLHGRKSKNGSQSVTLIGAPALEFTKKGGKVELVALVDREGSAIPSGKDLVKFARDVLSGVADSAGDVRTTGLVIATIGGGG